MRRTFSKNKIAAAIALLTSLYTVEGGAQTIPFQRQYAQTLERKAATWGVEPWEIVTTRYSDTELLARYRTFLPTAVAYQKRLDAWFNFFAKSHDIGIDEVTEEVYNAITNPIQNEMKDNPILDLVFGLGDFDQIHLAVLLRNPNDNIRLKREIGEFYPKGKKPYQTFLDPELTIPERQYYGQASVPTIIPNPRTFRTLSGNDAIELYGDGSGIWANKVDFAPKPGPYAISAMQAEVAAIKSALNGLTSFLNKIYPLYNEAELEARFKEENPDVRAAIVDALHLGKHSPFRIINLERLQLSYSSLKSRKGELEDAVANLSRRFATE